MCRTLDQVKMHGKPELPAPASDDGEIWKPTISGGAMTLASISANDIDLHGDVAETLARICRFGGAVPGNPYSVAQHCVVMADAAIDEIGDPSIAAFCLLHDAHEYVVGDIVTPVARWLSLLEAEIHGTTDVVRSLIATAKARIDAAVWRAAGLPQPRADQRTIIADYDIRMLAAEKRQLLMPSPRSWGTAIETARPIRMRGRITAWAPGKAAEEYRNRLDMLCPNARRV